MCMGTVASSFTYSLHDIKLNTIVTIYMTFYDNLHLDYTQHSMYVISVSLSVIMTWSSMASLGKWRDVATMDMV